MDWKLEPGDTIERTELHRRYGGRTQGGIGPSKQSPNVLIFSDPASGEQHGYFDGWGDDDSFHYVGEGQYGDQRMISGNKSILVHEEEGRALRLFKGARSTVEYVGEFGLATDPAWYYDEAPETGNGPIRQVIVFRLRPLEVPASTMPHAPVSPAAKERVEEVPVEAQHTERTLIDPNREPHESERREAKLVLEYRAHLRAQGHEVCRLRILPPGERKPLFTDLLDKTTNELIEAKGTATREAIRMAIGQLADYRRFVSPTTRSILVPNKPRADIVKLVNAAGIDLLWKDATNGFTRQSPRKPTPNEPGNVP